MTPSERGAARGRAGAGWRRPRVESTGIQRYIETVRERFRLVVLVTLVTTGMALLYVVLAPKVYEADADLLITPVSADDPVLTGLGLIRESSDPTRDVETAARLVTSRNVAEVVRQELNLSDDADDLAEKVDAEPVAQSNIVAITARAEDPKEAADLANGFAEGVVAERSAELRRQLDPLIERTRERIANGDETAAGGSAGTLVDQLDQLERLKVGGDPAIRVSTRAVEADSPVAPRPVMTIFAGILGGLVLGIGGAFAVQTLDPRLRREEQLRELFSLPILARIPKERNATRPGGAAAPRGNATRGGRQALGPGELSPRTIEAYRTLRTVLAVGVPENADLGRAILVTGPSPSEGKTTTAVNLASSFALAGKSVILIEADYRRPSVSRALRVRAKVGAEKVLLGEVDLEDALVPARTFGDELRVLPAERPNDRVSELLSLPVASRLVDQARQLADYVILDTPPLTEVVDALPIARHVDDVLLVCRLGSTNLDRLVALSDLLEQNEIDPTGFVVVGAGSSDEESYYMVARRDGPDELGGAPSSAERGGEVRPKAGKPRSGNGRKPARRAPTSRS